MPEDIKELLLDFKKSTSKLKEQAPNVVNGFAAMYTKIMRDGVMSLKTKELIATAIGVAVQCDPCIRLHVRKCLDLGLTKEEILEAASVAVVMAGGPAWTHMPIVIETIEQLRN